MCFSGVFWLSWFGFSGESWYCDTAVKRKMGLKCKFDVQIVKLVGQFKGSAFVCLEISSACPDTSAITVTFLSSQRMQTLNNKKLLLTWINAEIRVLLELISVSLSGSDSRFDTRDRGQNICWNTIEHCWIQIRNKSRVRLTFFMVQGSREFKGEVSVCLSC